MGWTAKSAKGSRPESRTRGRRRRAIRKCRHVRRLSRRRGQWPHHLLYGNAGVNCGVPKERKDDAFRRVDEVVVAFRNMRTEALNIPEGLLDEFFHILHEVSLTWFLVTGKE